MDSDIERKVDKLFQRKRSKLRKFMLIFSIIFGAFIITFLLITTIVIPILDDRRLSYLEGDDVDVGEEVPPEPEAYHYWYAPEDSFGISSMKTVNWSWFKQLFLNHTDWMLEYKRYENSEWTNGDQYLTINRTWNDSGFWKFNLIFDVPVYIYSARFTFGIDLSCLQYVERDGYEVWINYSANQTETYSCMFNWSDIASIPNLVITKGIQDDMFWFRFRRDDIPPGYYEFDPTFGDTDTGATISMTSNTCRGLQSSPATDGTATNITFSVYSLYLGKKAKVVLYDDDASDVLAISNEISLTGNVVHTGEFITPVAIYSANTYHIAVIVGTDSGFYIHYSNDGGSFVRIYDSDINYATGELPSPYIGDTDARGYLYCSYTEAGEEETWQDVNTTINGEFTNGTTWEDVDTTYNGEFTNTTLFRDVNTTINGAFTNTTLWRDVDTSINGAFTNLTLFRDVDTTINGVFTNATLWQDVNTTINGVFTNLTIFRDVDTSINGAFTNTTLFRDVDTSINGEFTNTSPANITITNPYPANESTSIPLQIIAYATITNTAGRAMSLSFYYGNSTNMSTQLGSTQSGLGNGTYNQLFYPATNYSTTYYWRIYVNDGVDYVNNTFYFTTTASPGGGGGMPSRSIIGVIGIIGLVGLIIGLMQKNKKKRRRYERYENRNRYNY